jgi:uncharacterized protein (TIGR02996 family)
VSTFSPDDATAATFEKALLANPQDVVARSAYADYLAERGDPRGEFMQVQLALEDESLAKPERDALKKREAALLKQHERDWLGELAPFVLDAEPIYRDVRSIDYGFARGWLDELGFHALGVAEVRALARSPGARMLTRLIVESAKAEAPVGTSEQYISSYYEPGPDIPAGIDSYAGPSLYALAHAPQLAGVRVFQLGDGPASADSDDGSYGECHTSGENVLGAVRRMVNLEELYLYAHGVPAAELFALPMPRLRVLRYDHADEYPLHVLAENSSLGGLTHLLCHPHAQRPDDPDAYIRLDQLRAVCRSPHLRGLSHLRLRLTDFGDDGAEEIVRSGILKRLKVLDLSYGCLTDRGAATLAACPDLKHLEWLNLTMNALGDEGIALLNETGVRVTTDNQHGEHPDRMEEGGYLDYLGYGDME